MRFLSVLIVSILLSGCATLIGSRAGGFSAAAKRAKSLVGHDIAEAASIFGHPFSAHGGTYMWSYRGKVVGTRFVQTGSQYVGSSVVGEAPGGHGVAGRPIHEDQYRSVGYYAPVIDRCVMIVTTDKYGVITSTDVMGTACDAASGYWLSGQAASVGPGSDKTKDRVSASLEPKRPLGCNLARVAGTDSPVALYAGVADCVLMQKSGDGVALYVVADTFSRYDDLRVATKDPDYFQKELTNRNFRSLDPVRLAMFYKRVDATIKNDELRGTICNMLVEVGPPTYYPRYMFDHGRSAKPGATKPESRTQFDSHKAWTKVIDSYPGCHIPVG